MIKNFSHAAMLAHNLAETFITGEVSQEMFSSMFEDEEQCEGIFALVMKYKFTGESLYLHHCGQDVFQFVFKDTPPPAWRQCDDDFRLALSLYCTNVPILAAFVPPEEAPQDPQPADPRRGFDSILHDDDNRGSIYDKETLRAPQGEASQTAENTGAAGGTEGGLAIDLSPAIASTSLQDAVGGEGDIHGTAAGVQSQDPAGSDGSTADQVTENTDTEAELGEDPTAQPQDPTPADPAPAADAPPDKPIILAKATDGDDDPHSGGDVVDEGAAQIDEDDAEGEIVGDEPPATKPRKKRR